MTKKKFMKAALGKNLVVAKKSLDVPVVSPFANWDYYYLRAPISWHPEPHYDGAFEQVKVPRGFVTDFASIPRAFWSLMPPTSTYTHPAIIHDYLYWTQSSSRSLADQVFQLGMMELRVPQWQAVTIYHAVKWFGGSAWANNGQKKSNGEKRILSKFPNDPSISWEAWKEDDSAFM